MCKRALTTNRFLQALHERTSCGFHKQPSNWLLKPAKHIQTCRFPTLSTMYITIHLYRTNLALALSHPRRKLLLGNHLYVILDLEVLANVFRPALCAKNTASSALFTGLQNAALQLRDAWRCLVIYLDLVPVMIFRSQGETVPIIE